MRIKYLSECILLILEKLSGRLERAVSVWKQTFMDAKLRSKDSLVRKKRGKDLAEQCKCLLIKRKNMQIVCSNNLMIWMLIIWISDVLVLIMTNVEVMILEAKLKLHIHNLLKVIDLGNYVKCI